MSKDELERKVKELRELRRMSEEVQAEIDSLTEDLKAEMTARDTDTLTGVDWKATWKLCTTSRVDATALREAMPVVAERFTKTTTYRRFCLA